MKVQKMTEDKPFRITVRLSAKQHDFIEKLSKLYGVNESEVIRLLIDSFRKGESNENKKPM